MLTIRIFRILPTYMRYFNWLEIIFRKKICFLYCISRLKRGGDKEIVKLPNGKLRKFSDLKTHHDDITRDKVKMEGFNELYDFLSEKCFGINKIQKEEVLDIYEKILINSQALINGLSEFGQGLYLEASVLGQERNMQNTRRNIKWSRFYFSIVKNLVHFFNSSILHIWNQIIRVSPMPSITALQMTIVLLSEQLAKWSNFLILEFLTFQCCITKLKFVEDSWKTIITSFVNVQNALILLETN